MSLSWENAHSRAPAPRTSGQVDSAGGVVSSLTWAGPRLEGDVAYSAGTAHRRTPRYLRTLELNSTLVVQSHPLILQARLLRFWKGEALPGFRHLIIGKGGTRNRDFLILAWSCVVSSFTHQLTKFSSDWKVPWQGRKAFPHIWCYVHRLTCDDYKRP